MMPTYGVPCGFIDKRTGKNVYFLVTVVDEEDKPLVEGIEITDYNRSDVYKAETLNDILDY